MSLHLGEAMSSVEELRAEALRQEKRWTLFASGITRSRSQMKAKGK